MQVGAYFTPPIPPKSPKKIGRPSPRRRVSPTASGTLRSGYATSRLTRRVVASPGPSFWSGGSGRSRCAHSGEATGAAAPARADAGSEGRCRRRRKRSGSNSPFSMSAASATSRQRLQTLVQRGIGALLIGTGAFTNSHRERIVSLAARYAVPAIYALRESVAAGGLMSHGTDNRWAIARLASMPDGFSRARSPPTCRSCSPPNLSSCSTSRPRRRRGHRGVPEAGRTETAAVGSRQGSR
jgi:hypothetical protein